MVDFGVFVVVFFLRRLLLKLITPLVHSGEGLEPAAMAFYYSASEVPFRLLSAIKDRLVVSALSLVYTFDGVRRHSTSAAGVTQRM